MDERAKIIAEQALALPADEREELFIALAASLGRHPFEFLEERTPLFQRSTGNICKRHGTRASRAGLESMPPSRISSGRQTPYGEGLGVNGKMVNGGAEGFISGPKSPEVR